MGIPPFGVPSHLLVAATRLKPFGLPLNILVHLEIAPTDSGRLRQVLNRQFHRKLTSLQSILADAGCIPG